METVGERSAEGGGGRDRHELWACFNLMLPGNCQRVALSHFISGFIEILCNKVDEFLAWQTLALHGDCTLSKTCHTQEACSLPPSTPFPPLSCHCVSGVYQTDESTTKRKKYYNSNWELLMSFAACQPGCLSTCLPATLTSKPAKTPAVERTVPQPPPLTVYKLPSRWHNNARNSGKQLATGRGQS